MAHLFQPLLILIATASKKELARQIQYLKVENEILRSKLPGRITVTGKERSRLVRFAQKLGTAIHGLATIATPPLTNCEPTTQRLTTVLRGMTFWIFLSKLSLIGL